MDETPSYLRFNRMKHGTYSWMGQAPQYDFFGDPGITYRRFVDDRAGSVTGDPAVIDTLLYYDEHGELEGILNTYPYGATTAEGRILDKPGNVCLTLAPTADKHVERELLAEARRRWSNLDTNTEVQFCLGSSGVRTTTVGALVDGNRRIARLP